MYHPKIVEILSERFEATSGLKLRHHTLSEVDEWLERLPEPAPKVPPAELDREQKSFILNERALTTFDFDYWATRYGKFIADPETTAGGLQRFVPWETQRITLKLTADRQLEEWERKKRGETVWGIRRVDHKARALGLTQLACFQVMHRFTRTMYPRCMSASVSPDKVQELYDRHKIIYDNLPWFIRPRKKYDHKAVDFQMEDTGAAMLYQMATQEGGLSQGRQRDVNHITEMAHWDPVAGWGVTKQQFELQMLPTLPRALGTLVVIESTSLVSGDWFQDFTERVRFGKMPGWFYNFIPWYAEPKRYISTPPVDWSPSPIALRHARMVHETSQEFVGRRVILSKPQLYWWETTHNAARDGKALRDFLTNFAATPEESFQHATASALPSDVIEWYRTRTKTPAVYGMDLA